MPQQTIGFIGAGRMAQALAKGFVSAGLVGADGLRASDPSAEALAYFADLFGKGAGRESNTQVAQESDVLFVATKPQYVESVLAEVRKSLDAKKLVVSIAAGTTLRKIEAAAGDGVPVVRVMPNTPCLVGSGACAYALGSAATAEHGGRVAELLGAVGAAHEVAEPLLDAVTGLSGSGPAFIYTVIESLADGGVRAGLPRALAADLAARTVAGAAQMVLQTGEHPAALRDAVTSPGGTTIAGLAELEKNGLRSALVEAVTAAARRSAELA
ncbi:Pyrroline-5-carboxylate reductase [Pseudobythopirellula maris]|uniref:Pyrroline-5-carboxylate reductase n=1 Tax=Pseudobythopirellula maris TaxID=2527991 RepID=A0A5C5ZI35_9BACT|nr:pyrroline-5-carboxylate reductase [Pseudobythopirellula maris]TWT86848.1 Pyrroline-5-carboxylate reductase [Pseudobythopirellula maris]